VEELKTSIAMSAERREGSPGMEGQGRAQERKEQRNMRGGPVARCARVARALVVAMAAAVLGTLNFGSAGPGSMTHLVAEMLKIQAGIVMNHVVYRGGTPALNDVLAGQIPMTFATVTQALPQYQSGLVRALGVTAAGRYASIPNVPTFREQGFDLVASEWYALLAPAGTPKPVVAKLNAEMRRIMALPNLGERLAAIELLSSSPEELSDFIRGEIDRWSPVIKKLGLKAE
jgi:tripartite-type tricarboxylate transporter receptor subunit TctC